MNRFIASLLAVVPLLFSCASNVIYRYASEPEIAEMNRDNLDAYPFDVRRNLNLYTNAGVGWAGIILHTDVRLGSDGLIHAVTTFQHHYFDWEEDRRLGNPQLNISPRGEGLFRIEWVMQRNTAEASNLDAEEFAKPGKLAIVYGVPEKVEGGTVILRYRYLRMVDTDDYNTNVFDYGRFGEPYRYIAEIPVAPTN